MLLTAWGYKFYLSLVRHITKSFEDKTFVPQHGHVISSTLHTCNTFNTLSSENIDLYFSSPF